MPPRKDNGRIMDMLEKRGYVTRVEDVENAADEEETAMDENTTATATVDQEEQARRFFEETPAVTYTQPASPQATAMDAYKTANTPAQPSDLDRFMDVPEIYTKLGMALGGVNTIYLIEDYIATLPDSLPPETRRSIVLKIVAASGFDYDGMVNDGIDRVNRLADYSTDFANRTDASVAGMEQQIADLNRQIGALKGKISERRDLHKRQFLALEVEAQRLQEVLDFITK